jgi:hypothetical protein
MSLEPHHGSHERDEVTNAQQLEVVLEAAHETHKTPTTF